MTMTVMGIVRDGRVLPDTPLPEGVRVEVRVVGAPEISAELADEFAAWDRATDKALALIDEHRTLLE